MTRKDFLRGVGAAGAGGIVAGGVAGFFGGRASESTTAASTTASTSKQPIVIGSGSPVTGAYAGDGQQMIRGQRLAVAEINAAGGVLGRPVKLALLDTQAQQPDVMKTVFQKFVSQKVAAIFASFCTYTSVEFPIAAQA
ncbi:MAG TPA: ABC transporter substrate-binding protein, partial [Streptosporangiaceae bacterium]